MPFATRARLAATLALLLAPFVLAGAPRAADPPAPSQVRFTTNMGEFVIEVRSDRAPLTAQNFLRYVREGFYTNTLIHRAVANFVIQGGGFDATAMKPKPTHEPIINESGNGLQNKRGAIGMARSEPPHSGNAQFYINLVDNPDLDPVPTRWGYAVFGRVIQGMDVVDRIGEVGTGTVGPFKQDSPLKPVIIEKAEILGASSAAEAAPPTPVPPPRQESAQSPK
jgi:cyclophilin family peptidyl-prolyl cis-trans isomerase